MDKISEFADYILNKFFAPIGEAIVGFFRKK